MHTNRKCAASHVFLGLSQHTRACPTWGLTWLNRKQSRSRRRKKLLKWPMKSHNPVSFMKKSTLYHAFVTKGVLDRNCWCSLLSWVSRRLSWALETTFDQQETFRALQRCFGYHQLPTRQILEKIVRTRNCATENLYWAIDARFACIWSTHTETWTLQTFAANQRESAKKTAIYYDSPFTSKRAKEYLTWHRGY